MLISTNKFNRGQLTEDQKEAFKLLVPLAKTISDWTNSKCIFLGKPTYSIPTSLVLADLIYQSSWLTHPLAKPVYMGKYSNNIGLLLRDDSWQGKINEYEGFRYKSYRDWLHFASDYSDVINFSPTYVDILRAATLAQKTGILALKKPNSVVYNKEIINLIEHYNLGEFDGYGLGEAGVY